MQHIYGILLNFIISMAVVGFYNRITKTTSRILETIVVSMVYSLYRLFTTGFVHEPFRIVFSFIFFVITLVVMRKKWSLSSLLLSFFMSYTLWLLSAMLSVISIVLLGNNSFNSIVSLTWTLILYFIIFTLDVHGKINLSLLEQLMETTLVYKIAGTIGVLIITLYSFINIVAVLDIANEPEVSILIWIFSITVVFVIIFLTIFTVKHLNNEKRKQKELELANAQLEQERLSMQSQLAELDTVYTTLKKDFGKVTSSYHSYKYSMPVLLNMQRNLLEEINPLSENTTTEKLSRIQNYIDQVKTLSFQINHDFVADHIKSEIASLEIPQNYLHLVSLLEKLTTKAQDHEVYLSIENHVDSWENLNIPDIVLVRLISNLVDNAIKESRKVTKDERGEVKLIFEDIDGNFSFRVSDFAAEFDINILKKLGERKNSTNGTGDGYAEIMADLTTTHASFILKEWKKGVRFGKVVSVVFDNHDIKMIDSHYRQEQLKIALTGSVLDVLDVY